MIQSIPQHVTFDEFIAWYPENSPTRYELNNGVIIDTKFSNLGKAHALNPQHSQS